MSFSDWKKYKLSDVVEIKYGKDHKHLSIGEIPVYGSGGIMRFADKFLYDKESILIPRKGTLSNLFYLNKPFWSVDTMFYTKIIEGNNGKFLYYLLKSIDLASMNVGSAVPSLTTEILNKLEINLPNKTTQTKITDILSSIDDKIELNHQTNQTLETIAQTLFKEMCLPKSEELPTGWSIEKLENLIDTVSVTHKMKQEEIIFLNTSDILEGNVLNNEYSVVSTLPGQAKKSIKRNDILFSEIRPANKRYAFVNFDADDYVVSTKLMVLRSKGINPYLIYCFLTNNDILKELQHLAETRSGTFPQITFTQLKDFKLVIPDETTLIKVSKNIQDIYENIFLNNKETQTLTVLRDSLLPKLMNGEIAL